jgi:hypothetical protein
MFTKHGFTVNDIPAVIPLARDIYDIAVNFEKGDYFDSRFQHLERDPFSNGDPLVRMHGRLQAVSISIERYKTQLKEGVWPGSEEWFKSQVSDFEKLQGEMRLGMEQVLGADSLAIASLLAYSLTERF